MPKKLNYPKTRKSPAKHTPTPTTKGLVEAMLRSGVPQQTIADAIGISRTALVNAYAEEIKLAHALAVSNVAKTLYEKAMNGDNACLIFYLKTQGRRYGWAEYEHTPAVNVNNNVTFEGNKSLREDILRKLDRVSAAENTPKIH